MAEPIRVLVVDEADIAGKTATDLERQASSLNVETAGTVSAALDRLASQDVDCVVAEYDLGGQQGRELVATIEERWPELPCLLYTRVELAAIEAESIAAGITGYLPKGEHPNHTAVLASQIETVVAHHRAERKIERTERRYRRLIEESTDVITVVDEVGRYTYLSDAAERLLGYPPEELVGESGFDYIHPDDRERTMARFAELVEDPDRRIRAEFRFERADGGWVWLEVYGRNLLEDPVVTGIVVYARDVTERIRSEQALERERDRLSTLFDNFPEPAIEYEFVDGEPVIRAVNEAFVSTFGYTPADALGVSINELVVPSELTAESRALDEQVRSGERLDAQVRRRTAAGDRVFHIRNIATPEAAPSDGYAIYSDITNRLDRERKLDQLRERVEALMYARSTVAVTSIAAEAAHDIIGAPFSGFYLLTEDGEALEPVEMIDAVEEDWGVAPTYYRDDEPGTRSAIVWKAFKRHKPLLIDDTRTHEALAEAGRAGTILSYPVGDHGVFIMAAAESRAFNETDKSLAEILVTFARAALDRVERETALLEREDRLERQNERLEEFASVVSHDLRNPLNVLIGSLELAEGTGDPEAFERANRAVERMIQLIDDVLELARAGETVAEVAPVALAAVVSACWGTVETATASLENQCERSVLADESRLQQLFENLVRNAVDHGGEGVTVIVGDLEDGFFVEDDGPGIDPAVRDRVFDGGFSTATDGTGFGLAIVKQIADAHGWDVTLSVGVAGGARFEVTGVGRPA